MQHPKELRLNHYLRYTLEAGESRYDIRNAKRNDVLFRRAISDAHNYTLQNVPPQQERGFRMEVRVGVEIFPALYKPKVADMVMVQPESKEGIKADFLSRYSSLILT